jgi:hypothetical protein
VKVCRQCPFVLPVKAGCKQGKALRSEEGSVIGSGMLGMCSGGKERSVGAEFVLGGQRCDEILIALGGPRLGEKFEVKWT